MPKSGDFDYLQNIIDGYAKAYDAPGFIPHVTIGRVKSMFKNTATLPIIEEKVFSIETIAVVRSFIDNKGSKYKNLGIYKLK